MSADVTKGAQTRGAILQAAIARFGRDGYRATSVADIARDAGVSGTAAYAYFPNKEALFLAAVDEDAASLISQGLGTLLTTGQGQTDPDWRQHLFLTLVAAVDHHPLAGRLLGGREPDVTERVMDLPALAELRKACSQRLRDEQAAGCVRTDIDVDAVGAGVVAITISLLMSVVQIGPGAVRRYADDVAAVFEAAIAPPPLPS